MKFNSPEQKIAFFLIVSTLIIGGAVFLRETGITGSATTNFPPEWNGQQKYSIAVNTPLALDLNSLFSDPEGASLTFTSTQTDQLSVSLDETVLKIIPEPGFTGERIVTVFASDGGQVKRVRIKIEVGVSTADSIQQKIDNIKAKIEAKTSEANITPEQIQNIQAKIDARIQQKLASETLVEAIIIFKEDASFETADSSKEQRLANKRQRIKQKRDQILQNLVIGDQITGAVSAENADITIKRTYDSVNAIAVKLTQQGFDKLKNDPSVESINFNDVFSTQLQDSVPLISANAVQNYSVNDNKLLGSGVGVCILDTGIDTDHPAFSGRIIQGPDYVNDDAVPEDDSTSSHGTHVSGIAAGSNTIAGVAPNATIIAVKVCDSTGSCAGDDILAGIDYCNNNSVALNISVISGSLGDHGQYNSTTCPTFFDDALSYGNSLGITSVYASGNDAYTNGVSYPACSPYSISVGSSTKADAMSSFTNKGGNRLDIIAPGSSINSTTIGSYGTLSGTSMSTPHVSGAVALLIQNNRIRNTTNTPAEIRQLLKETATVKIEGYPRLDVFNAIAWLNQNYTINATENKVERPSTARIKFASSTDLDEILSCVNLSNNFVSIDSNLCPQYNKSAEITLEGLGFTNDIQVLRDGVQCPSDICTNISYSSGVLAFNVTGFSNYSGNGSSNFSTSTAITACGTIITTGFNNLSNNISVFGSGDCITVSNDNILVECHGFNITHLGGSASVSRAFLATGSSVGSNITIQNCILNGWGTGIITTNNRNQENHTYKNITFTNIVNIAIDLQGGNGAGDAKNVRIINNTFINMSVGIEIGPVVAPSNLTIQNNTFINTTTAIFLGGNGEHQEIIKENAFINGSGIKSKSQGGGNPAVISNIRIINNTFRAISTAIELNHSINGIVSDNIITNATTIGLSLSNVSRSNFSNNNISVTGGNGILFASTVFQSGGGSPQIAGPSANNTFNFNEITAIGSAYALKILDGGNNTFNNTIIRSQNVWIEANNTERDNFINTTFDGTNRIRFSSNFSLSSKANITIRKLNVSGSNIVFVNSSNLTFINTSAEIILRGLSFINPNPTVDFEDDGTFVSCSAPACIKRDFVGNSLRFDVASFTSYSSQESTAPNCPTFVNTSSTLDININGNGSCIVLNNNNIVFDCAGFTITGNGTGIGINATNASNSTIKDCFVQNFSTNILLEKTNNTFIINSTSRNSSRASLNLSASDTNRITNSIFITNNAEALTLSASSNNSLTNNTFAANTGAGISFLSSSTNNTFRNTTIQSNNTYVNSDSTSPGNNFTDTTFQSLNGSIRILPNVTIPSASITAAKINVTFNRAFLNSSNLTFLNKSAEIVLSNIINSDPRPLVDFEDDGTFAQCPASICTELSFSSNIYLYNVTQFTAYSSEEGFICPINISASTTLTQNAVSNGSCVAIGENSITLDCAGFTITGNGSGIGINATNRKDIEIKNCLVRNFSTNIYLESTNNSKFTNITAFNSSAGIILNGSNNNTLLNNTLSSSAIVINFSSSSRNNSFRNTTLFANNTWIVSDSSSRDNNFTNTSFVSLFGSVRYQFNFTVPASAEITVKKFNITSNRVFLNSSNLTFLNKSAIITLNDITYSIPKPRVDFEDDGTFTDCVPPTCSNLSYNNNIFTYNVSRFSTYSSAENSSSINSCTEIQGAVVVTGDINATSDPCISFTNGNTLLDCRGFRIIGGGTAIGYSQNSDTNTTIKNCNIINSTTGIDLFIVGGGASPINNSIINNTFVNIGGTALILTDSGSGHLVVNNTFINSTTGISISDTIRSSVINNTFINTSRAIIISSADNISFDANGIISTKPNALGVTIASSRDITFNNTFFQNITTFIESGSSNLRVNFTNTTFDNFNSSVRFLRNFSVISDRNITARKLNINFNRVFVNTTNLTNLNTSAEITFRGLDSINPKPIVDFEEDGTFIDCTAPTCTELSFSSGTFVFNVTRFTTYTTENTTCPFAVNESTTLTQNLTANVDCITFNASNTVLNCAGFTLTGKKVGTGINATDKKNITIKDCIVRNFSKNILLRTVNDSFLFNNTAINGTGGFNGDVQIENSRNIRIENNSINANQSKGIYLNGGALSSNHTLINNTITSIDENAMRIDTDNNTLVSNKLTSNNTDAVLILSSNKNILRNNIATSKGNAEGILLSGSFHNVIINNTAIATGFAGSGISLTQSGNNTVTNNTLTSLFGTGITLSTLANNNTLSHNIIISNATGIIIGSNAHNNTLINNTITSLARGIVLSAAENNTILNNTVSIPTINGTGISLGSNSERNRFVDTTIRSNFTWIISDSSSTLNNFTDTTFDIANGSVRFIRNFTMAVSANISNAKLNISFGRVFVNTSNLTFLNTSAEITLRGISFSDPTPTVDFGDTGALAPCPSGICTELSFSAGTFVFNVTRFTIYAANETSAHCGDNITNSTALLENISTTSDCISINASNVTLDCKGFSITGDGGANDKAIKTPGTNDQFSNITVKDCNIVGFGTGILHGQGNTSDNNYINNTFTNVSFGIDIQNAVGNDDNNARNMRIVNNTFATGATGIRFGTSRKVQVINNTFQNLSIGVSLSDTENNEFIIKENVFQNITRGINSLTATEVSGLKPLNNSVIANNTINNASVGIQLNLSINGTISDNNIINIFETGIGLRNVTNSRILRNNITVIGANGVGLLLRSDPANITFDQNIINATGSASTAILLINSTNNAFNNTFIQSRTVWLETRNSANNNITNTTFSDVNGSIRMPFNITLPATANITIAKLNISRNNTAFLNASNLTFLNTSAVITLRNVLFNDPRPLVDFEDDGTFDVCPASICTELSFSANTFTYNVTRFTSYSSEETIDCQTTINQSTTLIRNITGAGTCITVGNNNTIFNCNGFTLTGNGSGIGINATGRINVTVQNCVTRNFTTSVLFEGTNNSFIFNVTGTNVTSDNVDIINGKNNRLENISAVNGNTHGIMLENSFNNTLINNTAVVIANRSIFLLNSDNNTIFNNKAVSTVAGNGIRIDNSNGNNVTNNFAFGTAAGDAIRVQSSNNTLLINNTGNTSSSGQGIRILDSKNSVVRFNTLMSVTGAGLRIETSNNIEVINNTGISNNSNGILLTSNANNITVINNTATSVTNEAINIDTSSNNTFINNIGTSSADDGILISAGIGNILINNTFITNTGRGINLSDISHNNSFFNTTIQTNSTWIFSSSDSAGNNITNTLFESPLGSIRILRNTTIPAATTVTITKLNISNNRALLNSSDISFLNQSAEIVLRSLGFSDPRATVDFEDDGTFSTCPSTICTKLSFVSGTLTYNVTQFTSYSSEEGSLRINRCPTIVNTSSVFNESTSSNSTCIFINNNSITLNCQGNTITGNGSGAGINLTGVFNVTIQDCRILNFTNNMLLQSTNSSTIMNNTLINSSSDNLETSSGIQNMIRDNLVISIHTTGINITGGTNNTLSSNNVSANNQSAISINGGSGNNTIRDNVAESNSSQGILLSSTNNNTLTNNTGISNSSEGIRLSASSGNILTKNTGISSSADAIVLISSSNGNILINNTGTSSSSAGINLAGGSTNLLIENIGRSTSLNGVVIQTSQNNLTNNTGTSTSQSGITFSSAANNNTLTNNVGLSTSGRGIILDMTSLNVLKFNLGRSTSGTGISILGTQNGTFVNNTAISTSGVGILLGSNASYNILSNNTGTSSSNNGIDVSAVNNRLTGNRGISNSGIALRLASNATNNTLINNTFVSNATGISIDSNSSNNSFANTTIQTNGTWIITDSDSSGNNFTNTLFEAPNGSIRMPFNFTMPSVTNITSRKLNISFNRAFLNSSNLTFLNQSAEILLRALQFIDPRPLVDLLDGNSFGFCPSTICTESGFTAGIFTFNVTSFTSYSSEETPDCGPINNSATLTKDLFANGTCLTVNGNNVTINCSGFTIRGNRTGIGINVSGFVNITIRDCLIDNFSTSILFDGSNDSFIFNVSATNTSSDNVNIISSKNNLIANSSVSNGNTLGIVIDTSSNITIINNTVIVTTNNSIFSTRAENNTLINNKATSIGSGSSIRLDDSNRSVLINNIAISANGAAITMQRSNNNNLTNNTATASGGGKGIRMITSNSNVLRNNRGTSSNDTGIELGTSSNLNELTNNTAVSTNNSGIAIISSSENNVFVTNNATSTIGFGFVLNSSNYNTLTSNNMNSTTRFGIIISNSQHNVFTTNIFRSLNGTGLSITEASTNNTFGRNTIQSSIRNAVEIEASFTNIFNNNSLITDSGSAINLSSSGNTNAFYNTTLQTNSTWILADGSSAANNMTNTLFDAPSSNLRFARNVTILTGTSANLSNLNLTFNRVFVNASVLSFLNTSAEILLRSIGFANPQPTIDVNDNGTFSFCQTSTCTETGFAASIFTFNVTSFTSYSSEDTPGCGLLNNSITLSSNLASNGTCLTVNNNSITINCIGFNITGNTLGVGINATGKSGIRIIDCNIRNFSNNILFNLVNNSIINNVSSLNSSQKSISLFNIRNSIVSNSIGNASNNNGIYLAEGYNNTVENFTGISQNDAGISVDREENSTLRNNVGISYFTTGITISSTNGSVIINNTGTSETDFGIAIGILRSVFRNNKGTSNSSNGIRLANANNNTLDNNTGVSISRFGIQFANAENNTITNNNATSTTGTAFYVDVSSNNTFVNNIIRSTSGTGLNFNSSINNIVSNNTITGIFALQVNRSERNTFVNNSLNGITTLQIISNFNNTINETVVAANVIFDNITFGNINYTQSIDFTNTIRFIDVIRIANNSILVNKTAAPQLNRTAILTLIGVSGSFGASADIAIDEEDDGTFVVCPSTKCVLISSGANVVFNVTGFTTFKSVDNITLVLSDDTDTTAKVTNENITFFANFTNSTGSPANTSNDSCRIRFDTGSGLSAAQNMTFNISGDNRFSLSSSFGSDGTFIFSVNCTNKQAVSIESNDTFVVGVAPAAPSAGQGGGGGGALGVYISSGINVTNLTRAESCGEYWVCEAYSPCYEGIRTRSCRDINNCGTTFLRPPIEIDCPWEWPKTETEEKPALKLPEIKIPEFNFPTINKEAFCRGAQIVTLLLLIILVGLVGHYLAQYYLSRKPVEMASLAFTTISIAIFALFVINKLVCKTDQPISYAVFGILMGILIMFKQIERTPREPAVITEIPVEKSEERKERREIIEERVITIPKASVSKIRAQVKPAAIKKFENKKVSSKFSIFKKKELTDKEISDLVKLSQKTRNELKDLKKLSKKYKRK